MDAVSLRAAATTGVLPRTQALRSSFSWTLSGFVVYAASQWGMLTVLAKLGTPQALGEFALALALTAPVMLFARMNLATVQATDATREFQFSHYHTLRVRATAAALLIVVAVIIVGGYSGEAALVILLVGVAKAIENMSDVFLGLFQQRERMDTLGTSLLLKGPLSLAAFGIPMYLTRDVRWAVMGLVAAWGALLIAYDVRQGAAILASDRAAGDERASAPRADAGRHPLRRLLWLALPMGVVSLLDTLIPNVPRYFLERHLGLRELGLYAAMAYVFVAGQTVVHALASAVRPRLAARYAGGERSAFVDMTLKLAGACAIIGVGAILAAQVVGREILTLLYTDEYADRIDVFVWLMVAGAVAYVSHSFWSSVMAARYFVVQVPLYAATVVVSLIASALLIPRIGLMGAAMAMLVASLVQIIGLSAILVHAVRACTPPDVANYNPKTA
jgi:O-antigen/teichoic acid export membrane protein